MKTSLLILLLSVISTEIASTGELAELYNRLVKNPPVSSDAKAEYFAGARPDFGIDEIGFEQTPCLGTCPVFTVIFRPNGLVRYKGESYAPRVGADSGNVTRLDFDRLAELAIRLGIWEMKDTYSWDVTDMPTVYIYLKKGTMQKVIRDYGLHGPAMLDVFRDEINSTLQRVRWGERDKQLKIESILMYAYLDDFIVKDMPIEDVLRLLSKKIWELDKTYGEGVEIIHGKLYSGKITLSLGHMNAKKILDVLMPLAGLKYYVSDKGVVVSH